MTPPTPRSRVKLSDSPHGADPTFREFPSSLRQQSSKNLMGSGGPPDSSSPRVQPGSPSTLPPLGQIGKQPSLRGAPQHSPGDAPRLLARQMSGRLATNVSSNRLVADDDASTGSSGEPSTPRTFAYFNASFYSNQNTNHQKSFNQQLQRMNSKQRVEVVEPMLVRQTSNLSGGSSELEEEYALDHRPRFDTSALYDSGSSSASTAPNQFLISSENVINSFVSLLVRQGSKR